VISALGQSCCDTDSDQRTRVGRWVEREGDKADEWVPSEGSWDEVEI
jgi:hypothetical protein